MPLFSLKLNFQLEPLYLRNRMNKGFLKIKKLNYLLT
jgi:hypothetical protein